VCRCAGCPCWRGKAGATMSRSATAKVCYLRALKDLGAGIWSRALPGGRGRVFFDYHGMTVPVVVVYPVPANATQEKNTWEGFCPYCQTVVRHTGVSDRYGFIGHREAHCPAGCPARVTGYVLRVRRRVKP
jgi:hypothetical protein